jgi:hypothetical protein
MNYLSSTPQGCYLWSRCDLLWGTRAFLLFPLEAHAVNELIYASKHPVPVLLVEVIQERAQDFIQAKQFYGNCFGIKIELDRK